MRGTVHRQAGHGQAAERYFVFSRLLIAASALAAVPVMLIADLGFGPAQGLILGAFGAQIVPALLVQNGWTVAEGQGLSVAILAGIALALAVLIGPGVALIPLLVAPLSLIESLWLHTIPKQMAEPERPATSLHRETAMLDAMDALVLEQDAEGQVISSQGLADAIVDASPDDLMGRAFFERVHVADRPAYLRHCDEAARGHQPDPLDVRIRVGAVQSAPHYRTFNIVARPLTPNEARGPFITIVRRADENLEAAPREDTVQDRILAVMTHELRTPLNAIIGFADLLASDLRVLQDDERRRDYARIIRLSGEHLLEVVNTVLDASKLQAGAMAMEAEPVEFHALLDETIDIMRLKAEKNGVVFAIQGTRGGLELVADKRALRQILLNLLSNAVKFSPHGGTVTVTALCDGPDFILRVDDCGVGIAARDIARIGEPFYQAQNGTARAFEGTGLGLSVVRGLVALHGGAVSIESEEGRGTSVTIRMNRDSRRVLVGGASCRNEAQLDRLSSANAFGVKKIA